MTGAREDQPLFDELSAHVKGARVLSFVGQTSLEELAALFERATFMVTGDSGPMHIAAAVGPKRATIFVFV